MHPIDNANVWLIVLDDNANVVIWNKAAEKITGYSRGEVVGQGNIWEWLYPDEDYRNEVTAKIVAIIAGEEVENFETTIQRKDGHVRRISWNSRNLTDEKGIPIGAVALGRDITELKKAEEQIKASLREKEVLLKEIHHRVKNNLQVVTSLLSLQSRHIKDKEALELFAESQSRVKSMSLVHEKLYQSADLSRIDFAQYIQSLAVNLFNTYRVSAATIKLHTEIKDVFLGVDAAIPCGLIINELISNALKYAFPDGRAGTITITMHPVTENEIELKVSDNGIGLPEDLDFRNTQSLGMQLVTSLVGQLHGTIELDRSDGTAFTIISRKEH